jgi:hypothetical protein
MVAHYRYGLCMRLRFIPATRPFGNLLFRALLLNLCVIFWGAIPVANSQITLSPGIRVTAHVDESGSNGATQVNTATVQGTVRTVADRKPLPNVQIVFILQGDKETRHEVISDKNGSFSLKNFESGSWDITVSANDMLSETGQITLIPGEMQTLDIALEEAEGADVLKVTNTRSLVHPESTGVVTHEDQTFLQEFKTANSLQDVIKSTPGIMNDTLGNIVSRGEHDAVNYEIDGVVLPEAAGVLQQAQFTTPRALQSMDVNIGGYQAKDGGGPLGAVIDMKPLPIQSKPTLQIGGQLGGPPMGNLNYYASGAFSQNPKSPWNKLRIESIGAVTPTSLGLAPPSRQFSGDNRVDMNFLTRLEYTPTERDTLKATLGINEALMQVPQLTASYNLGYKVNEKSSQNYLILSWKHKYSKWIDESNLHIVNALYSEKETSTNVFNPYPIINGDGNLWSVSPYATRKDYALSVQGDISKTVFKTHHLLAGFLTELRPSSTKLNEWVYDADQNSPNFGKMISPFTGLPGGPNFQGSMGNQKQFRYIQSAYLQDTWKPASKYLKRLTLNSGVRFDLYHGVFGATPQIAETIANIPGVSPFLLQSFQTQRVTDAQVSGRFGATYLLTKNTVLRSSFSNLFVPPPCDAFVLPFIATGTAVNGIFPGSFRPLSAMRGQLVDASIDRQIGPRFVMRNNFFYKQLKNFGDSGVIDNTTVYDRLTLSGEKVCGVETRFDLKPNRESYGFNGFVSNTVAIALLDGSRANTGGVWDIPLTPITTKYPDHDRRESLQAGVGFHAHNHIWCLAEVQAQTGFKNEVDAAIFGPQPARVPPMVIIGFNIGYKTPEDVLKKHPWMPTSMDVRILNLTNQMYAVNLGSPYQGTRYTLPMRVIASLNWNVL